MERKACTCRARKVTRGVADVGRIGKMRRGVASSEMGREPPPRKAAAMTGAALGRTLTLVMAQ